MGVVGRYLDAGEDRHRDRVIEGQEWLTKIWYNGVGGHCLVGHAEGWKDENSHYENVDSVYTAESDYIKRSLTFKRFDRLCARFTQDRIVRLCKMRAAKGNAELVKKIRNGIYEGLREESHVV